MERGRGKGGRKYKLLWKGCAEGLNGVWVIIAEEFIDKVVKVVRVYDRLMMVKVLVGQCLVNIVRKRFEEVLDIEEKEERNINQLWESTRNGVLKATEEVCGWMKGSCKTPADMVVK